MWGDYPTPNLSIGYAAWSGLLSLLHSAPPYLEKFFPKPVLCSRGIWDIYEK
jgi:hypothetical protein